MGIFPGCLHVVQGVCNLGDVEQPDYWRKFSAAAAAAQIKDFIILTTDVEKGCKEDEGTFLKSYSEIALMSLPMRVREGGKVVNTDWVIV